MTATLALVKDAASTSQYDPWSALAELDDVTLAWHDGGDSGLTQFSTRTISLRRGMSDARTRATLTHELVHLERGPAPKCLTALEEVEVERIAAERLLPLDLLAEAFIKDPGGLHQEQRLAAYLDVDQAMLGARLATLSGRERLTLAVLRAGAETASQFIARDAW